MDVTEGKGVDLTLNPISGETLKSDLEALAPLGTAVIFGFLAGPPAGTFAEDLAKHFQKSVAVRVSDIYTYFGNRPDAFSTDMAAVFDFLRLGVLRPQITTLPITEAAEAHRRLEAGETTGKLVLSID
jgi:NADPH2:quinone reductase